MKKFTFKYKDEFSHGKWNTQVGYCKNLSDLISFYGLDKDDVEWELIKEEDC